MGLVVIEAPGKVETVRRNFPFPAEVVATRGHLFDLPEYALGIEEDRITLTPVNADLLRDLYHLLRIHDEIYIATDPDREGEVIAQQIYEMVPSPERVVRIRPLSLDREGLREAIRNAQPAPEIGLARAGLTRRVVDRLIGFTLSRQAKKELAQEDRSFNTVSIGRVKTAALRQFRAISTLHAYRVKLVFALGYEGVAICDGIARSSRPLPTRAKEGWFRVVGKPVFREETSKPLTTALFLANRARYGSSLGSFSAYRTAQKLYEEGIISYIRTREEVITPAGMDLAAKMLEQEGLGRVPTLEPSYPSGGHESIRPARTIAPDEAERMTGDQQEVYRFIKDSFLDAAARKKRKKIVVRLAIGDTQFDAELESEHPNIEEMVRPGAAAYGKAQPAHGNIRLHDMYLWMDRNRIGTPGTYASSVWGLVEAGYITPGMLVTPQGRDILEWVEAKAPWLNEKTSRTMEDLLDEVRQGRKGYLDVFDALREISREKRIPLVKKDPAEALRETVRTYCRPTPAL
jgi:DNA topoisomerase IA